MAADKTPPEVRELAENLRAAGVMGIEPIVDQLNEWHAEDRAGLIAYVRGNKAPLPQPR